MADYRVDATAAASQQSVLYLHNISSVLSDTNVIFFLGINGEIVITSPFPSRVAFVALGTGISDYRFDTLTTASQWTVAYLHGITTVLSNTDVVFFIDVKGNIVATAPVASRVAFVSM